MKKTLFIVVIIIMVGVILILPEIQKQMGFYPAEKISGNLNQIQLPPGFSIEYYAQNVSGARSMALSKNGILYVGTRTKGNVYAVIDENKDGLADKVITIASGLFMPNGVALHDGDLYVAEVNRILKFEDIDNNLHNNPQPIVIKDDLPDDEWHGWKFIAFGPDEKLYVPVGVPCNVCETEEPYGSILRMDKDGSNQEVFVQGMRNTVGFDWHPKTGELWWSDNGRDWWGDNVPPDELNHAPKKGMDFGFPYCHGKFVDYEFNKEGNCNKYTPPVQDLDPHVAALGIEFYTLDKFPKKYKRGVFIAEHGSWNRKDPIGYRVTFVELENNTAVSYTSFAKGWLQQGKAWGRPVHVLETPDGDLLVSDDFNNAIYKITYDS